MERRLLWRRWVAVVAAGELAGFAVPAVTGILARDLSSGAQLVLLPVAGLFEGALLGFAQAVVLGRAWDAFRERAWVVATSLAAAVAWFLGMLPSTTHDTWSTWPAPWAVVVGVVLGTALLASIGTAQALVLPPGTRGRVAWVGWTALGWCAGLTAFTVVAPPLWQPGQATWLLVVIGVAGGLAMAVAMAAVTGVGAVRLVDRDGGFTPGRHRVSSLLGTAVYDDSGRRLGRVHDLVADLARDIDRPPITYVLIRASRGQRLVAPYSGLTSRSGGGLLLEGAAADAVPASVPGPTGLLLRRDVLDSPVVLAEPPRRTRVSDVVVDLGAHEAMVSGVDLNPLGMVHRFVRGSAGADIPPVVPLSQVHLASAHGHAAQLSAPGSSVLALPAHGMAEVLTRVSVAHAREIIDAADHQLREEAVRLLHPHVRARVTGSEGPPRRTRRFNGWRVHRPGPHTGSGGRG